MTLTAVPYPYTETTLATNLATNPSLETVATGWGGASGSAASFTAARLGPYNAGEHRPLDRVSAWFWRAEWASAATSVGGIDYTQLTYVIPGTAYSAGLAYRSSVAQRLQLAFSWRDAANVSVGGHAGPAFTAEALQWAEVSLENKVAPAGADRLVVTLYNLDDGDPAFKQWAAGHSLDGDNIRVTTGATITPPHPGAARLFDGASPQTLVGARYAWDGVAHESLSRILGRTPTASARAVSVPRARYGAARASATVLHDVIGRADPLPSLGTLKARTGTLDLWCATEAGAHDVVALYGLGKVVMLRDAEHPDLEMYHVATDVDIQPESQRTDPWRWVVSVRFAEVYGTAGVW